MSDRIIRRDPSADAAGETYWHDNRNFARLFNEALFDGRAFFHAEDLTDCEKPQLSRYAAFYRSRKGSIRDMPEEFRVAKRLNKMRMTLLLVALHDKAGQTASFTDHAHSIVTVTLGVGVSNADSSAVFCYNSAPYQR